MEEDFGGSEQKSPIFISIVFLPSTVRSGVRKGHLSDAGAGGFKFGRTDRCLFIWGAQRSARTENLVFLMLGNFALWQLHNSFQYKLWNVGL